MARSGLKGIIIAALFEEKAASLPGKTESFPPWLNLRQEHLGPSTARMLRIRFAQDDGLGKE